MAEWGRPGAEALEQDLRRQWPALRLEIAPSLPSTNSELLSRMRSELTASTAPVAPWLLVAERQTQGRGRMGRTWLSRPDCSVTFSLAFESPRADLAGLSLAIGVALANALDPPRASPDCATADANADAMSATASATCRLMLKWPNDLLLCRGSNPDAARKLGGVLIESLGMGARRVVVVGVGLNVRPLPPQETATAGAADALDTAALSQLHADVTPQALAPQAVLSTVAPALLRAVDAFMAHGFAAFAADFARRDLLAGQPVVSSGAMSVQGLAEGVDRSGALRVRDPVGNVHCLSSGEISVRAQSRAAGVAALEVVAC